MWAKITSPTTRSWIYRLGIIISAYLAVKGYIDGEDANFVNMLLAAFFAIADINVPRAAERQAQAPPVVIYPEDQRPPV